jgi:glycosyltransferase involved in cell wall biosynthesis
MMIGKKRVLLLTRPICPPWDEGSKDFAFTLAKYASDFEIHVLTHGNIADLADNVVQHPIYTSPKWNWPQKIRAYFFLIREFFLKGGNDYDILHSFFTPTRLNVLALKLCLRNKKTKTIQTIATLRDDMYSESKLKKIIHADFIVTYSDYAKEKLQQLGFVNTKRIYPGIDLEKFSPAAKKPELLEKFNTGEKDFVINYTGEYLRLGDMDDIIESFIEIAKDRKKVKLHLAVRVKNPKDALKKIEVQKKLRLADCIDQAAFIDDGSYEMQDIYNLADISIFPARTMAGKFDIPLAIIEAMACGKPVIASDLPRLKYFLNDENSIIIPAGNAEALKENIIYLCDNFEVRNDFARRVLEFVRENFDIMKIVKEYEEVYQNI